MTFPTRVQALDAETQCELLRQLYPRHERARALLDAVHDPLANETMQQCVYDVAHSSTEDGDDDDEEMGAMCVLLGWLQQYRTRDDLPALMERAIAARRRGLAEAVLNVLEALDESMLAALAAVWPDLARAAPRAGAWTKPPAQKRTRRR